MLWRSSTKLAWTKAVSATVKKQVKISDPNYCFQLKFVYYFAQNIIHLQNGRFPQNPLQIAHLFSPAPDVAGLFL